MANQAKTWFKQRWRLLFVILTPLMLLPIPIIGQSSQSKCGYIVLLLTLYWISEVLPLPVTSLLPLILFPMTGIITADVVATHYFKDIATLFLGGTIVAHALECVNLHRRIALFVLNLVGSSIKWTMAGLMVVTAFLSMWISNASTTLIMLPVAMAIIDELQRHGKTSREQAEAIIQEGIPMNEMIDLTDAGQTNGHTTNEIILDAVQIEDSQLVAPIMKKKRFQLSLSKPKKKSDEFHQKEFDRIKISFLLAVAYSATIGGLSSLVGSGASTFLKGYADAEYKDTNFQITFFNYLLFALPIAILMLVFCWFWLQMIYNTKEFFQFRADPNTHEAQIHLKTMLAKQYHELGRPKWSEIIVGIVFFLFILLRLTKNFSGTPGWEILFAPKYVSDGTVAMLCGLLPLILPNSNPFHKGDWQYEPIVRWNKFVQYMPWGAWVLLGASLAVASAFQVSKLSDSVAYGLRFLSDTQRPAMIMIIIIISALFTEVTSNVTTASVFFPVLDSVARTAGIHPGYLILPCTVAICLAFMLPIATPPNTIIFASGTIRVTDMVKTGAVMNLVGFCTIFLASMTWMPKVFDLTDQATQLFFNSTVITMTTTTYSRIVNGTG